MGARLYIPRLGDELVLAEDWRFKLFREYRNDGLFEHLKLKSPEKSQYQMAKLPAGARLKVDRIFIRKGAENYDSVTFILVGEKTKKKVHERVAVGAHDGAHHPYTWTEPARAVRFWVKLEDANDLVFQS